MSNDYKESVLFLKGLIKSPLKTGAFFPSSKYLAKKIANYIEDYSDGYIIEIGAGTGRLTKAILKKGIASSRIVLLETQPFFANFLQKNFNDLLVIEGDANNLLELLPDHIPGKVHTIVSSIPMVNLCFDMQLAIIMACKSVLKPDGRILQFTYRPHSPLPYRKLNLCGKYLGSVLMNIPPANVWEYKFHSDNKFFDKLKL